jgi:hypothetical protein
MLRDVTEQQFLSIHRGGGGCDDEVNSERSCMKRDRRETLIA